MKNLFAWSWLIAFILFLFHPISANGEQPTNSTIDIEKLSADLTDNKQEQVFVRAAFYDIERQFRASLNNLFSENRYVTVDYNSRSGDIVIVFSDKEPKKIVKDDYRWVYWPDRYIRYRINYRRDIMTFFHKNLVFNRTSDPEGFTSSSGYPLSSPGWVKTVKAYEGYFVKGLRPH